ncbi:metal ABC transporter permease [Candidatus Allofournierella merdavium]|uniref:metal ABC transporter permease n=1 Tax=Candidatus Allofournierella merdavium TaxID=2838593 RepID=UPI00374FB4F4
MTALFAKLAFYWSYPFVRCALAAGVLIALCSSLLGVTLVLRRLSFIGDGLSHVAFGSMSVAAVAGLADRMPLTLALTMVCAVLLLRSGHSARMRGDAAIAILSVGSLAAGYLLMNLFAASSNLSGDVCTTLFGSTSILTLTPAEVWLCAGAAAVVVTLFLLFYNKLFAVTFDEDFSRAAGVGTKRLDLLMALLFAAVIVLSMRLVGSLLVSALVVFPAVSAMQVFGSFRAVTVGAAALSVTCAAVGILTAVLAGTPVGATVVAVELAAFSLFWAVGRMRGGAA